MRGAYRSILLAAALAACASPTSAQGSVPSSVTALGRLEPGDGAVDVAAARDQRVARLEVVEGQEVTAGAALAYLDSHPERVAEREAARARVDSARRGVERVRKVGPLEVEALEAEVRRMEAELEVEEIDLERFESLAGQELIPDQDLDRQRAITRRTRESLAHARALLRRETESQRVELLEAQALRAEAQAGLGSAEARLERSVIRAPTDGRVLRIFTWPGETVTADPILRLGETGRMYAVAEVYETDVRFLREGQEAVITSPALPGSLRGTIERIGTMVYKNDVLGVDPAAETDARIVEVRIQLQESDEASRFIHLQVDVEIDTGGAPAP